MRTVLFAQLRTHAARLIACTLAIVIAVGFVVATLVLNQTARATVLDYVPAAKTVTGLGFAYWQTEDAKAMAASPAD